MLHILLIEDSPADVLLVREAIRTSAIKADVVIAYDGEQAMRLLAESDLKLDFILIDLSLPKFNGLQVLERYRANAGPPVIVLSGSAKPEDRERALGLGAREYVLKPSSPEAFIEAVQRLIERWMEGESLASSADNAV